MKTPVGFRREGGFLLSELIVSISLIGMIVVGLAVTMQGTARLNRFQWARQQCIAAAQAQIDSLTATGKLISDEEMQRLWPKVKIAVDRSAGQGQWAGLELLRITATLKATSHPAEVRLARYVQPAVQSAAGGESL
jgi:type II secretory pathway pseudopilin PulG